MKRIIATLAGLGVAFVATLAFSSPASAHTKGIGGEFCSDHGAFQLYEGKWYQCVNNDGHFRWEPSGPPVSKSPTPQPSASPSKSAVVTTSASKSAGGAALPVTGAKEDVIAGVGAGIVLIGGAALWFGHRRRNKVRFTA